MSRGQHPRPVPQGKGEREPLARPKRSLGQNFLVDRNIAAKIVASLGIAPGETVIEIGPGRGALAGPILTARPGAYLALEKDRDLARRLVREYPGVSVAMVDALALDWRRLDRLPGARLIGNLPYNIASPLLWDLCAGAGRFARGVFMVQHEVARRLAAGPDNREYGALSAWIGNFVTVEYCFKVPPTVFVPQPKVDSAVVAVTPRPVGERPGDPQSLARLLKLLFASRRKQLRGILKTYWDAGLADYFAAQGISEHDRPENVSPDGLRDLAQFLKTRLAS
jgi:16S rRNA (adenine1518-N6/adenine1519-N6)-dimethyltransferase